MANIASQKKRNARTRREHAENQRLTSAVKTYFKRLETAVESGDSAAAGRLLTMHDGRIVDGRDTRNT